MFRFRKVALNAFATAFVGLIFALISDIPAPASPARLWLTWALFTGVIALWSKRVTELRVLYGKKILQIMESNPDLKESLWESDGVGEALMLEYGVRATAEEVARAQKAAYRAAVPNDNLEPCQNRLVRKLEEYRKLLLLARSLGAREQKALKGVKSWRDALYL